MSLALKRDGDLSNRCTVLRGCEIYANKDFREECFRIDTFSRRDVPIGDNIRKSLRPFPVVRLERTRRSRFHR